MILDKSLHDSAPVLLNKSSGTLYGVENRKIKGTRRVTPLQRAIADALWYWMQKQTPPIRTVRALSALTGVDKHTHPDTYVAYSAIQNYLYPEVNQPEVRRQREADTDDEPTGKRGRYPTVDKLSNLARALGCQTWQLLHPNAALADALGRDFAAPAVDETVRVAQPAYRPDTKPKGTKIRKRAPLHQ